MMYQSECKSVLSTASRETGVKPEGAKQCIIYRLT
jgi:hypothetical protein